MTPPDVLLDMLFRVATAIVLGASIGLERQWRLRTAGIRTNALVSVGAALFVIVGAVGLGHDAGAARPESPPRLCRESASSARASSSATA